MRATHFSCPFTGRPAEQLHHTSGRDADGHYLDPDLVLPLSLVQHNCEHTGWNVAGFGDGARADPNVLRLRRNAHPLLRLADLHRDGLVIVPAFYVEQLAWMLLRIADALEAR